MTKITVTETYTRVYELDVSDLEEDTVQSAIDLHNDTLGEEPQWTGTCVTDEQGSEVLEF